MHTLTVGIISASTANRLHGNLETLKSRLIARMFRCHWVILSRTATRNCFWIRSPKISTRTFRSTSAPILNAVSVPMPTGRPSLIWNATHDKNFFDWQNYLMTHQRNGRITWFLRKGRSHLEDRSAINVENLDNIFLRWRRRHTLARWSSRDLLV